MFKNLSTYKLVWYINYNNMYNDIYKFIILQYNYNNIFFPKKLSNKFK